MVVVEVSELLRKLAFDGLTFLKEVGPGTYAYGSRQATSRVRNFQSASLNPFAARGPLHEVLLVGHVHVADGKVIRVEGFNGQEGVRWAERAHAELVKLDALAPGAVLIPMTPLRDCPHSRNAMPLR